MIEQPALLDPAVLPENWEVTTVTCRLAGKDRVLKMISLSAFARHVQEVQSVPYEFWEV